MIRKSSNRIILMTLISVLVFTTCLPSSSFCASNDRYGVFIGTSAEDKKNFKKYDVVVIDAQYYKKKDIHKLKKQGKKVYAYLNIGTIEDFRSYSKKFQDITYDTYDDWPDEKWVDVSSRKWQNHTVNVIGKKLVKKGVDGFFIDNTDVYYHYKYKRTYRGLMKILKGLKKYKKEIIINGGDTFVKKVIKNKHLKRSGITGVNQECVFTSIDFDKGKFGSQVKDDTRYYKKYLKKAKKSGLDVYVLEYAKKSKKSIRKKIKKYCRSQGYHYYISPNLELV